MKEYVVIYVCVQDGSILLVKKDRPIWQKGRYNLPGGKLEPGETPEQCAERELGEEAGYDPGDIFQTVVRGKIAGSWGVVHCVEIIAEKKEPKPREGETETLFWSKWADVVDDPLLIPNLRAIIPLMIQQVNGWVVLDEGTSEIGKAHTVAVTL